jgi:hypothetical protein
MKRLFSWRPLPRVERKKIIEDKLLAALRKRTASVPIHRSSILSIASFHDLLQSRDYKHFQNDSDWNPFKKLMPDVIGNMCPYVVLRSKSTGESARLIRKAATIIAKAMVTAVKT